MRDARIRFNRKTAFGVDLRQEVDRYFADRGLEKRGAAAMYRKAAIVMVWLLASYLVVLFFGSSWPVLLLAAVSSGLAQAAVGMSIMHDGGHRAVSDDRRINRGFALMLDVMGGSSYIWHHKHNVMHHTYPNVVGSDDDIDIGPLARLAPEATHHAFHRFQHLYMWPLYTFISLKWHLLDDFVQLRTARIGVHAFPRLRGRELFVFWAGKVVFFTWVLVIPILVQSWAVALVFYLVGQMVQGFTLAVTFQLAHCVEEATFFEAPPEGERVELDFVAHQLASTVDFAPNSRLLGWYMGGLNFQAVHHVFPRICHVHYQALSGIVAEVAARHGVPYHCTPTLRAALGSHYRWLKRLGRGSLSPSLAVAPLKT